MSVWIISDVFIPDVFIIHIKALAKLTLPREIKIDGALYLLMYIYVSPYIYIYIYIHTYIGQFITFFWEKFVCNGESRGKR